MTIEEKYSYYARAFNIICKLEGAHPLLNHNLYQLEVIANDEFVDVVTGLAEEELKQALEDLKTKTYLNI